MSKKAVFYHAGCSVCIDAERQFAESLDASKFDIEIVHLGKTPARLPEAVKAGVKSVPAIVIGGQPYHINFGASLDDLK